MIIHVYRRSDVDALGVLKVIGFPANDIGIGSVSGVSISVKSLS